MLKQDLTLLHGLAFRVGDAVEEAGDPRHDVHRARAFGLGHKGFYNGEILRNQYNGGAAMPAKRLAHVRTTT